MDSCVAEDGFYRKLVDVDCDDIVFKVHDLALLVSDVYQMKVFYIFLNHLYRSKRISKDERQRYTLKALQETFNTIEKTDQQALTMHERIVDKCRQDGVFVSGFDNHETDSVAAITDPLSSLPNKLAMTELRVGKIVPHTSTQSSATTNTASESIGHRVVLAQAQALGRSLKEVYSALDAKDANQASTGAICSILNALSFGQRIYQHVSSETLATPLLDEIIDYGDMNHICSVVYESGNEKLQNVFQQGIAIVEGAKSSLKSEDEATRKQELTGMSVLVSVIGHLANAVTKWIRHVKPMEANDMTETFEAISLLALAVTAKMIQSATESVEQSVPSHGKNDRVHTSYTKRRKGALSLSSGESSSAISETMPAMTSSSRLSQSTLVVHGTTQSEESHPSLVEERETTRGCDATALAERITRLEESMLYLVDELKGKRICDERILKVQMEQLEHCISSPYERIQSKMRQVDHRLCQLEHCHHGGPCSVPESGKAPKLHS